MILIINGLEQIAHIEGLDENPHILPFRHNVVCIY